MSFQIEDCKNRNEMKFKKLDAILSFCVIIQCIKYYCIVIWLYALDIY